MIKPSAPNASTVLLNNVDHHDLRVVLDRGPAFGDAISEVVVFPSEFEELQREYAILFRRDAEGVYRSVVLLGFEAKENLYLNDGEWTARYIPALLQRGPFSIGVPRPGTDGEPMIHLDESHPRISREQGERVFLEHGGNSPYLNHVADVLRAIYAGHERSAPMFDALAACGLIQAIDIEVQLADGRRFAVPDCSTIAVERLAELDGNELARLHKDDFLREAIWVRSSLGNIARLTDAKNRAGL